MKNGLGGLHRQLVLALCVEPACSPHNMHAVTRLLKKPTDQQPRCVWPGVRYVLGNSTYAVHAMLMLHAAV